MVYGAIDLHMRYSQIRIVDEAGAVVRDQRVPTTRERLTAAFAGLGPMRILLETGTESEWVAQALEAAGHEVVVADLDEPVGGGAVVDPNGTEAACSLTFGVQVERRLRAGGVGEDFRDEEVVRQAGMTAVAETRESAVALKVGVEPTRKELHAARALEEASLESGAADRDR